MSMVDSFCSFFFSSRRRHTRFDCDWSSDVCSSDLMRRETYETDRRRVLETLAEHTPREVAGVRVERVRDDDGYKFFLADGSWVLLRSSGTEALIRVYAEAASPEDVEARLTALEEIVGIGELIAHQ